MNNMEYYYILKASGSKHARLHYSQFIHALVYLQIMFTYLLGKFRKIFMN